jgi:hypothetical protein
MTDIASTQVPARKSRLWLWILLGVSVLGLLIVLLVGAILYGVEASLHSSDVYAVAINQAQNSPCVVRALGSPVVPKWFVSGNISVENDDGSADMEIPLHGPKGSGSVHVVATKSEGKWKIDALTVLDSVGQIQLLPDPSPCP